MAIQNINVGTVANDGTGDDLRTAFGKLNDNFSDSENAASKLVATTPQAIAGTPGVIPDAAGVKSYVDQFGIGGNLTYTNAENSFSERIYEVSIPPLGEVAVPLPTNACDVLVTGYTTGTSSLTGFKGRFYKAGGTTWNFQNLHGTTNAGSHPTIGVTGNVPVFKNIHPSGSYSFVWKIETAAQSSGVAVNVFASNQIIGTVSQSGGVPTGAIMDNSADFTRYANGDVCIKKVITVTTAVSTAGTAFPFTSATQTYTYPTTLVSVSSYAISAVGVGASFVAAAPNTTSARWVFTSSSSLSSQALTASIEIWGKWF